jgi:AcrR family transcriptional regulator
MLKKEQILATALEMINEKGYLAVGMRELARQLEVSPGNLTYHFSKKSDILIALLKQFSAQNSALYADYFSVPASNAHFLNLMSRIFESQFSYRGVYIGNQFVQAELQEGDQFDYPAIAAKRKAIFRRIFTELRAAGHLELEDEDISFLISYITLFARFWISEATLFQKSPDQASTIQHYLSLLAKQLSLFATDRGKQSIEEFTRKAGA